jgi:GNAT superfamily N-acetyltransferase
LESLLFRVARRGDLPEIIRLLADDSIARQREQYEDPLPESYERAFDAIAADDRSLLVVADRDGDVVGTLQLTFIPYLDYQGRERALVEAVRVSAELRGSGIGSDMLRWAIERARERGCHVVQLTTDKRRSAARRFYESLGFVASHEGMKLALT